MLGFGKFMAGLKEKKICSMETLIFLELQDIFFSLPFQTCLGSLVYKMESLVKTYLRFPAVLIVYDSMKNLQG